MHTEAQMKAGMKNFKSMSEASSEKSVKLEEGY